MLQRIHNGILFFLQTLGLFGILGFWLIVSLPLFFVNNKVCLSQNPPAGSRFFNTPRHKKSAPTFQRVPILLPYSAL